MHMTRTEKDWQNKFRLCTPRDVGIGLVAAQSPKKSQNANSEQRTRFRRTYIIPLLKVRRPANQQPFSRIAVAGHSSIGCHQVVLPNQRAVTDRRAGARSRQHGLLNAVTLRLETLHKTGAFGHRVIMAWVSKT